MSREGGLLSWTTMVLKSVVAKTVVKDVPSERTKSVICFESTGGKNLRLCGAYR